MTTAPDEPVAPPASKWARYGGLTVSIGCLAGVIVWAAGQKAPELPSDRGAVAQLCSAVAIYGLAMAFRGERWLALVRRNGERFARGDAYAIVMVGYMGNNVLPARGGDAIRVYLAKPRTDGTYREIVGTLVAERVLDAGFLLGLFLLLGYVLLENVDVPDATPLLAAGGIGLAVLAVGLVVFRLASSSQRVARFAAFLAPILAATRDLRGPFGFRMLVVTAVIWVLEAGTYWAAGAAAGLDLTGIEALYIVALASVFVLIPSGPGYVGTLDAALIFGARAVGATGSAALSFLVLVRFVLLVPVTLVGLVLAFARYGGWDSLRGAESGATTT